MQTTFTNLTVIETSTAHINTTHTIVTSIIETHTSTSVVLTSATNTVTLTQVLTRTTVVPGGGPRTVTMTRTISPGSVGADATGAASAGSPRVGTVPLYGQCGGTGFTGETGCLEPYVCTRQSDYYYQCLGSR